MADMQLTVLECLRCGHKWVPRKTQYARSTYPRACPNCQSWYWDAPLGAGNQPNAKHLRNKAHGEK